MNDPTRPTEPLRIEARGVTVHRSTASGATTRALHDFDLELTPGAVTAVVGPSGAGKSTLLQAIAGLVRPSAGDVLFDGRSVVDVAPEARELGVVFQSYALFPHLDVTDNVAFGLLVRGTPRRAARRQVQPMLERFEIAHLAERPPHRLSGGERQRVAVARALAFAPRALLLDEPLAALDARLRLALRDDLARQLRDAGVTALYVTHDQEEAMAVGDRVAVLRDGGLEQVGPPQELYERPRTPFVARFFGQANLVPGRWDAAQRLFVRSTVGEDLEDGAREDGAWHLPDGPAEPIEHAVLVLRPEHLRPLDPANATRTPSGDTTPRLRGRVTSSTFLGNRRRLRVEVGGDPPLGLTVDVEPSMVIEPGSARIEIGFEASRCLVLNASSPKDMRAWVARSRPAGTEASPS